MAPDLATTLGAVVAIGGGGFAVLTIVGIVLLARRARRARSAPPPGRTDAGVALVRADDAVRAAADELGFAIAQFGHERTHDFAAALARSRADLATAFALQQSLDDSRPESERRRREGVKRIRALADGARERLEAEAARFRDLRRAEADAPETARAARAAIADQERRRSAAVGSVADLAERYGDAAVRDLAPQLEAAAVALAEAGARLDGADAALASTRVPAVTEALDAAEAAVRTASARLDAVDHRRRDLHAAEAELGRLARECDAMIADARGLRDAPPDPDSAASVNDAIATLDAELARVRASGPSDPLEALDRVVAASDALDIALAAARNQQRRLEGARAALAGALVSARAQFTAASDLIGSRGGDAGARSRLAEAERELLIAENEADPVAALDAARRAQTHARDAEALANYAGL